jgi:hypothetical protein
MERSRKEYSTVAFTDKHCLIQMVKVNIVKDELCLQSVPLLSSEPGPQYDHEKNIRQNQVEGHFPNT